MWKNEIYSNLDDFFVLLKSSNKIYLNEIYLSESIFRNLFFRGLTLDDFFCHNLLKCLNKSRIKSICLNKSRMKSICLNKSWMKSICLNKSRMKYICLNKSWTKYICQNLFFGGLTHCWGWRGNCNHSRFNPENRIQSNFGIGWKRNDIFVQANVHIILSLSPNYMGKKWNENRIPSNFGTGWKRNDIIRIFLCRLKCSCNTVTLSYTWLR